MAEARIGLSQALQTWRKEALSKMQLKEHLSLPDLYDLVVATREDRVDQTALQHITRCKLCARELKNIVESIQEAQAWDVALTKAAASNQEGAIIVKTKGGKYTISIRRNLSGETNGLITVEANPRYVKKLEGKIIEVRDHKKRVLLRGMLVCGEISQRIEGIEDIDPSRLIVRSAENKELK